MFRQVVEEWERVLGREHTDTINARTRTVQSPYAQGKDKDAEVLRWCSWCKGYT